MLERPWYVSLNYALAAAALILSGIGLLLIRSATLHGPQGGRDALHQAAYLVAGVAVMIALAFIDYRLWQRLAWPLYLLNIAMLAAVAVAGHAALGAQRWIGFGPVVFQPSEPAKLLTTLALAAVLANPKRSYRRLHDLLAPLIVIAIPALLVMKQPDLGTALVLVAILTAMLFFALPSWWQFAAYSAALAAAGVLVVASPLLKEYQRQRLLVFLNPAHDPQGAGWSLIQSKIAIGSGQLSGKGLYHGTQTQLGFVPAHSTDFIFTVVGEEFGFVGAVFVLGLFALLVGTGIQVVLAARDRFALYVAVGLVAMFVFHIVVNIGMTVGIMPITGIPLPFLSYGGSSLIASLAAVGVLLNIHLQRYKGSFAKA